MQCGTECGLVVSCCSKQKLFCGLLKAVAECHPLNSWVYIDVNLEAFDWSMLHMDLLDEEQRKKRRKFCRGGIFLLGQRRKRRKMIRKGKYIFAIKKKNREGTGGKHFLPLALLDLKPEFLLEHERIDKAPVVIQWS